MQKSIAFIEPHHHSEVLRTFAMLFVHIGWQVRIFTNKQVKKDGYELNSIQDIQWYIQGEEAITTFIKRQKTNIDQCDLLVFVTLVKDFDFFSKISFTPKAILVIHNGNTFFDAPNNLSITPKIPQLFKDVVKWFRFFILQENKSRQQVLSNFEYLSLASSEMYQYFKDRYKKKYPLIDPLPFTFFEGIPPEALVEKEVVEIAIPGTVKEEGKDYEMVLAAFQRIAPELEQPVKLNLLGGAQSKYARRLVQRFQKIENDFFTLQYAPNFISQQDFDTQLRKVDFLILPIKKSYRLGIVKELYGYTNISGGINDAIRFGIPALIAASYPVEKTMNHFIRQYESTNELYQQLTTWIKEKEFIKLRENTATNLDQYSKEELAKKMAHQVKIILEQ